MAIARSLEGFACVDGTDEVTLKFEVATDQINVAQLVRGNELSTPGV